MQRIEPFDANTGEVDKDAAKKIELLLGMPRTCSKMYASLGAYQVYESVSDRQKTYTIFAEGRNSNWCMRKGEWHTDSRIRFVVKHENGVATVHCECDNPACRTNGIGYSSKVLPVQTCPSCAPKVREEDSEYRRRTNVLQVVRHRQEQPFYFGRAEQPRKKPRRR